MVLKLYNTRTRRKETFEPFDDKRVRMYVCGPTVYDYAHIGNARPVIVFDVLFRLLRHLYGPQHVFYARNITDVDDKINARAAQEGVPIRDLTERTTAQFHQDIRALGVLMPEDVNEAGKPPVFIEPRATEFVTRPDAAIDMIRLIQRLIERGHAYEAEGHVLFSVASDPRYGELSRRSVEEMRAGARVEIAPYKRGPMDFVLWKPSSGSEPGWDSPWGFGRPGWHLECSAMSAALLGETFDIHGGGIDLLFPHHENEVAQSTCAFGTAIMANIWMHNGHLQVEGAKMAKSLGNFVTIRELLQTRNFGNQPWHGEVIKLAMLGTHYRQPLDWTVDRLAQARSALLDWAKFTFEAPRDADLDSEVFAALQDDVNTPAVLAVLHGLGKHGGANYGDARRLASALRFLGLYENERVTELNVGYEVTSFEDSTLVQKLVDARKDARKAKKWTEADRIRDELAAMGITLKDKKNSETGEIETTWEIAR